MWRFGNMAIRGSLTVMYLVLKYFESIHLVPISKTYVLLIDVSPGDTKKVYSIDYGSAKKLAIP